MFGCTSVPSGIATKNRDRGFTLLEAVVGLAILGVILTSMLTILAQYTAVDRRVDAHLGALRSLETHHEALRSGWTPLTVYPFWSPRRQEIPMLVSPPGVDSARMFGEVSSMGQNGFYKVKLELLYTLGNQSFDQEMEVLFWRP